MSYQSKYKELNQCYFNMGVYLNDGINIKTAKSQLGVTSHQINVALCTPINQHLGQGEVEQSGVFNPKYLTQLATNVISKSLIKLHEYKVTIATIKFSTASKQTIIIDINSAALHDICQKLNLPNQLLLELKLDIIISILSKQLIFVSDTSQVTTYLGWYLICLCIPTNNNKLIDLLSAKNTKTAINEFVVEYHNKVSELINGLLIGAIQEIAKYPLFSQNYLMCKTKIGYIMQLLENFYYYLSYRVEPINVSAQLFQNDLEVQDLGSEIIDIKIQDDTNVPKPIVRSIQDDLSQVFSELVAYDTCEAECIRDIEIFINNLLYQYYQNSNQKFNIEFSNLSIRHMYFINIPTFFIIKMTPTSKLCQYKNLLTLNLELNNSIIRARIRFFYKYPDWYSELKFSTLRLISSLQHRRLTQADSIKFFKFIIN